MSASPSFAKLFWLFLKIGATSFGGNIVLVAAIRDQVVKKNNWLPEDTLMDATTLGSVLPGPLATNVTAFIGYRLRGLAGALVCLGAVLIPAFILLCVLSWLYFQFGEQQTMEQIFRGIIPGVVAVILATAIDMGKKTVKQWEQAVIVALAAAAMIFFAGFLTTLGVMAVSGLAGFILFRKEQHAPPGEIKNSRALFREVGWFVGILATVTAVFFTVGYFVSPEVRAELQLLARLTGTFGGMSVTLFGGGYVFVPAISTVVVDANHWVTAKEFADGIAMGQVTPGPIMISAAFIGWKVSGFWGAFVSTVAIFLPPAFVMVIASHFTERIRGNAAVEAVFKGMRPAVIGMILAAVVYFIKTISPAWPADWPLFLIFAVILGLALFVKKLDSALLIPISGLLGWLLYLI
ncbi:MAG: chromate transporter [Bacteroidetes bacterium]|nr:MAG: chromate transporter [Bacteroidota bacterium]